MSQVFRVCVCFRCKEYVPVHVNNIESQRLLNIFLLEHNGHTVQIVNKEELTDSYKVIK